MRLTFGLTLSTEVEVRALDALVAEPVDGLVATVADDPGVPLALGVVATLRGTFEGPCEGPGTLGSSGAVLDVQPVDGSLHLRQGDHQLLVAADGDGLAVAVNPSHLSGSGGGETN